MSGKGLKPLWAALDFRLSEVLRSDFYCGLLGGAGALTTSLIEPPAVIRATAVAGGLVGVVVGAVVAGLAVQTAFMDQTFLRKIRAINREPTRYLAPFLFTASVGVFSMLSLLVLGALSAETPTAVLAIVASSSGFLTAWTIASLLPGLSTLVQFIDLKTDALDVPDDIGQKAPYGTPKSPL